MKSDEIDLITHRSILMFKRKFHKKDITVKLTRASANVQEEARGYIRKGDTQSTSGSF